VPGVMEGLRETATRLLGALVGAAASVSVAPDISRGYEMRESIPELEMSLAEEDAEWVQFSASFGGDGELSRDAIQKIGRFARLYWLKNPLVRSGVDTQAHYVFGQDVTIRAVDPEVNEVVQAFLDDAQNRVEFTSHQARMQKETDLRLSGNLFFCFFIDRRTGRVLVRTIPPDEVDEIVCNPEDIKEPWFYLRAHSQVETDGRVVLERIAHVDWRHTGADLPEAVRGYRVDAEHPVYHVKVGGFGEMRFGVSEVYPALDWAKAYKSFLEDWATLARAYSRFAHKLTLPSTAAIPAARARLGTTLGPGTGESNPPPVTGSTFIAAPGVDLSPVRIGGANVSAEDGRRMLLMAAAALGLPETFFGDTQAGSLATAKSLDRPTELRMRARQTFWAEVHQDILGYVIEWAVQTGKLSGQVIEEPDGTPRVELAVDPETGEPRDATVRVEFPPILEHDVPERVGAIVDAATLRGQAPAQALDASTVSRLLLQALGVDDVDSVLDKLYPDGEDAAPEGANRGEVNTEAMMVAAVREMREALRGMAGGER